MKKVLQSALAFVMGIGMFSSSFAQLSMGGTPYSFAHPTSVQAKSSIAVESLQSPDRQVLAYEDMQNTYKSDNYRVGLNMPVSLNPSNSGTWESTPDGGQLWRLKISSDNALALGLYYSNFYIPNGGKVFIYNNYENQVIGAFTSDFNVENQIRATQMIQGESLTIEYYAPAGTMGAPIIDVSHVVYFYRGVEDFVGKYEYDATGNVPLYELEKADDCQVDVVCSEGASWTDQINSVVHYTFSQGASTYVCSASMINNTSQDCTPYILTAWHCGEPNAGANISTWVWYWNYQKTTCSPGTANASDPSKGTNTMTGGTVVTSSGNGTLLNQPPGTNEVAGSDFYLVELNSEPPTSYNAYYAGWDRTNTAATSGVGIHHPAGSAKKISTYTSTLTSSNFNGGSPNSHWAVTWSATTNGHGVTEGGSSGSPIFNQSGRIVGQLSGGGSYCTTPTVSDVYGKMYMDWDLNGTTANSQLAPWLDPINSGATVLDGSYQPCNSTAPPTCGINASATNIIVGGSVNFTDGSSGVPTSWSWNFDNGSLGGVSPATSTAQNPGAVTFSNIGTYDVQLIATNANGSCTTNVAINVAASLGCDTLLNIQSTDTLRIYGANGGYLAGWNGYADIAKAEEYSNYSPYTDVTGFAIYLYGVNDGGNNATVDFNVWDDNAGQPGTIIGTISYPLATLDAALAANGGQGILDIMYPSAINVGAGPFYCGIVMNGFGTNDSLGIVSNSFYDPTPNSGWEQWSDNSWNDMQTAWGSPLSMYISPYVTDQPVSGTITTSATSTCEGSTIDFTANATNATGYTWTINGGTPSTSTNATETVTFATAGTYMAYLELDGACSGYAVDSVQITVTAGPTATATSTDPTCAGNDGQIVVSATGATQYSIDGGTTFQASATFTGLSAGTYNVVAEDANGCQGTTSVTLNAGAGALTVSSTPTDPSCGASDGAIAVTATGGNGSYTYSIDGGTTFQAGASFSGLPAGTYDIVAEDGNGCQGTDQVVLANAAAPTFTTTSTDLSCNTSGDGSITFNATGGSGSYTYSVDNGTTYQSGSTVSGLAAGTYNVTVQDGSGCTAAATTVTLTEPTVIFASSSVVDASCGLSNGSISVTATGGSGTLQYSIDNGSTYQSSSSFTGLAAATYQVIVMDANGCTSTVSSETVSSTGAVSASATNTGETCNSGNGQIVVSATGGSGTLQYSIDGGVTFQASGTFTGVSAGTYNIVVEDAGGCQGTTTSTVTNTGGVTPTISPDQTVCSGNSATINAGGAGTGGSYSWDNGLGSGSSQVVTPTATTTYTVVITDASGCQATASTTITVEQVPTVTVTPGNTTICNGTSLTLTASGAQTYVWNNGATTSSITVTPTSQTTYTVIGQNGSCQAAAVSTTINVDPAPTVVANADQTTIQVGGTVSFSTTGSVASSYTWNFGDGNTSTQGTVTHTYNVMGTYDVVLTGTLGNCTATDTITIYVGTQGVDEVNLDDAISMFPNPNSGEFKINIALAESQDVNITLYNTIGQVVETRSLQNVSSTVVDFNLSNKSEGFYFVNVKTKNGDITKRISVIR